MPGDRLTALALLLVGLSLTAVAVPRVAGHLLMSAGDRQLALLKRGETMTRGELRAAIGSRTAALEWLALPDAWVDLGGLRLAQAQDRSLAPRIRRLLLDSSLTAFRRGLALGPARPYAWTQYAQAALARGLNGAIAGAALDLSMDFAPHEPPLVVQRVRVGFRARDVLPAPVAARIAGQVRLMARYETRSLAAFARGRYALGWVRAALRSDPALLDRFDQAYARLPPA